MINEKPNVRDVLKILEMKDVATKLYEEIDQRVQSLCEEFGADRFDYDLNVADDDNKRYLKFEITDNIQKLKDGDDVWKSVPFKPVTFTVSKLKNCPKSLKEIK